jgi:hypothetical protein
VKRESGWPGRPIEGESEERERSVSVISSTGAEKLKDAVHLGRSWL